MAESHGEGRVILNIDTTYFGRNYGVLVALDAQQGLPIYVKHIYHERVSDYVDAIKEIEHNGYQIAGIVIDGIQSLFKEFANYNVQMCQYHMCSIIRGKITQKPKLQAGIELQQLMRTLRDSTGVDFNLRFNQWKQKWQTFIDQRSINSQTGKTFYTHQRIMSAMLSIDYYISWLSHLNVCMACPTPSIRLRGYSPT